MKMKINRWTIAILGAAAMVAPAAIAQQASAPDPYQGVSAPPPDDTIVATPDTPAPRPKPSPAIPAVTPAPADAPAAAPAYAATPPAVPPSTADQPNETRPSYDNTDYGIVSGTGATAPASSPGDAADLHARSGNPDADIVASVPASPNELALGTYIRVRMSDDLSTKHTVAGAAFRGEVRLDVMKDGRVIIPAGSALRGRVVEVSQGHHFGPAATLRLRPDMVVLPDGTAYHFYGQVVQSHAAGTRTDREGGIQPSSHVGKKVIEYGVGAGAGALVGAKVAGPEGALVGSLVGAGLVTAHLLMQHPGAAVVPAGSELVFSLTEPMELTPTRN
jgi:outer membrane biosynthesis protein TonB